jgi:hypothetical protein
MCKNQSGNIACLCTCILFTISIGFMITYIIYAEDNNIYGELALFILGLSFIIWVARVNIKEDDRGNTKIHPKV